MLLSDHRPRPVVQSPHREPRHAARGRLPLLAAALWCCFGCVDSLGATVETPPTQGTSCTDDNDCTGHERCDESFSCIACLPSTCEQEGRSCGSFVDDCLRAHPCEPGCSDTESCSAAGSCVPTDAGLCASYSACGPVRLEDRSVVCPDCQAGLVAPFESFSQCCAPSCVGRLLGEDDGCGRPCPAWRPGPATGPSPRYVPAMAFHPDEGRTFLFGGQDGTADGPFASFGDLWSLTPGGAWTLETPVGELPGARASAEAAVTSPGGELVLFGGWDGWSSAGGDQCIYDDLFVLRREGGALTWHRFDPGAAPHPAPRWSFAMAATDDGRVFLFGGQLSRPSNPSRCDPDRLLAPTTYSDLWSWDGSSWTLHQPAGSAPAAREAHALAYDPVRRRLVLHGGSGPGGALADTWEYDVDDESWEELHPAATPGPLTAPAMEWVGDRTVLFGGSTGNRVSVARSWSWDGVNWTELTWGAGAPQPVQRVGMGAAAHANELLLFGGTCLDSCPAGMTDDYLGDSWILELP